MLAACERAAVTLHQGARSVEQLEISRRPLFSFIQIGVDSPQEQLHPRPCITYVTA